MDQDNLSLSDGACVGGRVLPDQALPRARRFYHQAAGEIVGRKCSANVRAGIGNDYTF